MFRYYNDVRKPAIWTAAPRYFFRGQFRIKPLFPTAIPRPVRVLQR